MKQLDVIVIGAGAAGLMCAWQAAKRGRQVAVLEHTRKPGKKILMSGGGRCNFTNLDIQTNNYLCDNPHFVKSALKRYTQWDFISSVIEHEIPYHERKHGQLFCDRSAKDILNLLLGECQRAGVTIVTDCFVNAVALSEGATLESSQGSWQCQSLVVATGGLSIPSMNTTPFAYDLAQRLGIPVKPLSAGLVPLCFDGKMLDLCVALAGNAIDISVDCDGVCFDEALLFTHRGISGPSVLQISNYWKKGVPISINLLPEHDIAALLCRQKQQKPKTLLRSQFGGLLPKALIQLLEQRWWPEIAEQPLAEISEARLREIGQRFNQWTLYPSASEGYKTAEVTLGGIDTDYVSSKTMATKAYPQLYFIGECLDVTGHLGGYNFQWAWSSAYAAAQFV